MATTLPSVCPLDCPDRCSLEVRVESGRVVALEGSRANPVTGGFICSKVRRYPERVYGPDRLLHPMRRVGAKGEARFLTISWDEALGEIAARLASARSRYGGESILPFAYGGSNGILSQGILDERLFRRLGASRLLRTVCAAQTGAASAALYGKMASVDFPDFAKAKLVLLWGGNPKHSNVHLLPYLKQAREAGGRVAVVDPRRILGEAWVDMHLPVFPGSDAAVALAMIGHLEKIGAVDRDFLASHATGADRLLEEARAWTLDRASALARVPARDIGHLAEAYAEADPALVRCGWGVERNRNGEAAVAAILALPAVAGKFGKPGGGYALSSSEAYKVDTEPLIGVPEPSARSVNMSQLGRALLEGEPKVRVLFVYDANPAVTLPDQNRVRRGLMRDDLYTVVFDQVMTDTARFADVVLPATTFLEQRELSSSYGTYALSLAEPVIPPCGEAKPNEEVFALLLERLGLPVGPTGEELLRGAVGCVGGPLQGAAADRLERLRRDRVLRFDFPGRSPVQFATVRPNTADGKARLWPGELGDHPFRVLDDPADPDHPLALISPSSDRTICSTLGEFNMPQVFVELGPEDAAARGLRNGQSVRVFNRLGEVMAPLRVNDALRPGVAMIPKGQWSRFSANGSVGTALVPDALSGPSAGACFNDARVQICSFESAAPPSDSKDVR
jgi:anaerobic selenocysteine-containing dehydrogenase